MTTTPPDEPVGVTLARLEAEIAAEGSQVEYSAKVWAMEQAARDEAARDVAELPARQARLRAEARAIADMQWRRELAEQELAKLRADAAEQQSKRERDQRALGAGRAELAAGVIRYAHLPGNSRCACVDCNTVTASSADGLWIMAPGKDADSKPVVPPDYAAANRSVLGYVLEMMFKAVVLGAVLLSFIMFVFGPDVASDIASQLGETMGISVGILFGQ
jgi:hypothetical protein